ncbi:hypothetical protein D9M70_500570 [compost metagenome]
MRRYHRYPPVPGGRLQPALEVVQTLGSQRGNYPLQLGLHLPEGVVRVYRSDLQLEAVLHGEVCSDLDQDLHANLRLTARCGLPLLQYPPGNTSEHDPLGLGHLLPVYRLQQIQEYSARRYPVERGQLSH